jgi:hypothetical protein
MEEARNILDLKKSSNRGEMNMGDKVKTKFIHHTMFAGMKRLRCIKSKD